MFPPLAPRPRTRRSPWAAKNESAVWGKSARASPFPERRARCDSCGSCATCPSCWCADGREHESLAALARATGCARLRIVFICIRAAAACVCATSRAGRPVDDSRGGPATAWSGAFWHPGAVRANAQPISSHMAPLQRRSSCATSCRSSCVFQTGRRARASTPLVVRDRLDGLSVVTGLRVSVGFPAETRCPFPRGFTSESMLRHMSGRWMCRARGPLSAREGQAPCGAAARVAEPTHTSRGLAAYASRRGAAECGESHICIRQPPLCGKPQRALHQRDRSVRKRLPRGAGEPKLPPRCEASMLARVRERVRVCVRALRYEPSRETMPAVWCSHLRLAMATSSIHIPSFGAMRSPAHHRPGPTDALTLSRGSRMRMCCNPWGPNSQSEHRNSASRPCLHAFGCPATPTLQPDNQAFTPSSSRRAYVTSRRQSPARQRCATATVGTQLARPRSSAAAPQASQTQTRPPSAR